MDKITALTPRTRTAKIQPPVGPRIPVDHVNQPFEPDDIREGRRLAWDMGSLEIDRKYDAPEVQWQKVVRALRLHGLRIVHDLRA
jgi:hypothetical protein